MELWHWISKIYDVTEQNMPFQKNSPFFQQTRPECKIENVRTGRQKKIGWFSVDGTCKHCNTVFEAMDCFFHYCPYQEARPSLTDNEFMRGIKKKEHDQMRKDYIQHKG